MKSISPALQSHLSAELTTLAYLVKITRADGVVKGFATHDRDLTIGGVTYKADGAMTPSAIAHSSGLATDNLDITGMLNDADITEQDIDAGLYDSARIDLFVCNWNDLTQGVMQLRRGWIGQIARTGTHYTAELRGLHDLLQRPIGATYTPECRYDLGDARCTVNLAPLTVTGNVTNVTDATHFTDTARVAADGLYAYAKLTWTSGANAGLASDVKAWDSATQSFTLWLPTPNPVQIGDAYSVASGCDKRFSTCATRFANAVNFGGWGMC